MRAARPLKLKPSSMVSRISPMPNKPITAIRKSKPFSNSTVLPEFATTFSDYWIAVFAADDAEERRSQRQPFAR
jgi:hypothetical protein